MLCTPEQINERLAQAERLWLLLDYDGTLADFAPTPEHVNPDPEIIDLLARLTRHPRIRVAVISGRRLNHVETLVPVSGILLAGTYGIELRLLEGERINRVEYNAVRPVLDAIKPRWLDLIRERRGFFLEDKGWALALHARLADDAEAEEVLDTARHMATEVASSRQLFRLLGGHKFLEVGPRLAHKGQTVDYLLNRYGWSGSLSLYVGDDDKDEEAFGVMKARGGIAILVAAEPRKTRADCRLESPQAVCHWLEMLLAHLGERHPQTNSRSLTRRQLILTILTDTIRGAGNERTRDHQEI
ncbi:MAG: trehalose-phosphatase [Chloroflexota bacterium]|nr:trehalose-phosphatase [Chloroflexota bacterium]